MAKQDLSSFFTSTKGAIATVGTLVAIAVGVHSLLPAGHTSNSLKADFGKITVYPDVDLAEYETRFGDNAVASVGSDPAHQPAALARPYRLARDTRSTTSGGELVAQDGEPSSSSTESTSSGEPSSTSTSTSTSTFTPTTSTTTTSTTPTTTTSTTSHRTSSTHTTHSSSSTSTSTTSSGSTTTGSKTLSTLTPPPPAQVPFKEVNGVPTRDGSGVPPKEVEAVAAALAGSTVKPTPETGQSGTAPAASHSVRIEVPKACAKSTCALTPLIDHALAYHANPIVAARAVAAAFADSRGRLIHHKLRTSGVAVNYAVDLVGFAHHEAILVWSLWSKATGKPLPKVWLHNVIANEVEPKREEESFSGQFWIPAPPAHGEYVVHLTAYDGNDIERGQGETEPPFH